jgi:superfamily II DNA helicase RecQ
MIIIYCRTKISATNVNKKLIKNKYNSGLYHAGLE